MTVSITNPPSISHFVGRAADTKPTADVPPGSTFTAIDTGRRYTWDGAAWGLTYALPWDTADLEDSFVDLNLVTPRVLSGEAVLDEGEADWTDPQDLIVITPAADSPLAHARLYLDLAKATTGFAAGYTSEELTLTILRKVDGTAWRITETKAAITGTAAAELGVEIDLGTVGVDEEVKVQATLSAEDGGAVVSEIPYALYYMSAEPPTVTAAEAGE